MARGMESFGPENLIKQIRPQVEDTHHSTLRSILKPKMTKHENLAAELYPTPAAIAKRVSYAKERSSAAIRVATKADLEMPVETTMAQTYAELMLLTSIVAGQAASAFVEKEQN